MASQQQQIIDTIFSMKRKLLRSNDCMDKPPAVQHSRVLTIVSGPRRSRFAFRGL
jgi:hypothetical protein